MTFRNCVVNGEEEGLITPQQKAAALDTYEQLKLEKLETMPESLAESTAAKETFDILKYEAAHRRRNQLQQVQAWKRIQKNLNEYAGESAEAAEALIAAHDIKAKFGNIEKRTQAISRMAFARMDDVLKTFKRGLFGGSNRARLPNMVKEIFEEGSTKDVAARQMAQAWKETAEHLRLVANNLGMRIANRKDWGLPQLHNSLDIRKAGKQAWIDYITPLLDKKKMIDEMTGMPIGKERLADALDKTWLNIATDGAIKVKDGASRGNNKSLVNRRLDHRFLVFKDSDSWMKYQEKFGEPDVFKTMVNHIESMSKDIAELEILGPNPKAMLGAIEQYTLKKAALKDAKGGTKNFSEKAAGHIKKMKTLYNIHHNNNNQPVNGRIANIYAGTSHILQAAQLGGAPLSAITDAQTQRVAARFSGLNQTRLLGRILKQLMPLGSAEKGRLAVRLGLGADNWVSTAISAQRYFGDITGPEVTRRISDFTMRLSGLSPMTQAGRQAFGLEYLGNMADNVGKTWDELPEMMREGFNRHQITKSDWDIIRETELFEQKASYGSAQYVDVLALENRVDLTPGRARDVATKLMSAILTETEAAVPSASYRARAFLVGESQAGTVAGSLTRSFSMYKNYSATVFHTHIMRYMNMEGSKAKKANYMADYIIGTTLMGGLAIQAKEMARGKDPRPMNTEDFWLQALLQGGGLGIFGDFVSASQSRFGGGFAETMAGPVVGLVGDAGRLAMGGTDNIEKNAINFMSRYTPGSSTWYLRLGLERLVIDKLHKMANPKYGQYFRRKELNQRRNFNNKYWWRPGKDVPSRPPNISNITQGR